MYSIHVESDFELQNCRCWQAMYNSPKATRLTHCGT
jgi:hypothetical protein